MFIKRIIELLSFNKMKSDKSVKNDKHILPALTLANNPNIEHEEKSTVFLNDIEIPIIANELKESVSDADKPKKVITDETIIDIGNESLDLSIENDESLSNFSQFVPYWDHSYIYSYNAIKSATNDQMLFYEYLKNQVKNSNFVDIQGNTNYAFVLYFDLLNEYESHTDIEVLDTQLKLLGEICPKTISYSRYSLRNKKQKIWKEKLNLNDNEVEQFSRLNVNWHDSQVSWFFDIEQCYLESIKLYLSVIKKLEENFGKNKTTLNREITSFKEKVRSLNHYSCNTHRLESEIYHAIFSRAVNSICQSWAIKNLYCSYSTEPFYLLNKNNNSHLTLEFERRIGNLLNVLIEESQYTIKQPSFVTQLELNAKCTKRWETHFDELCIAFINKKNIIEFNHNITNLEKANHKNTRIENIFFRASKFIANYNHQLCLEYYIKYVNYNLTNDHLKMKAFPKDVQKILFKTDKQAKVFKAIISDLIATRDLNTALEQISQTYTSAPKRIQLDFSEMEEVERKQDATATLLSRYLDDENEIAEPNEITDEKTEIAINTSNRNKLISIPTIDIKKAQNAPQEKIITDSPNLSQSDISVYSKASAINTIQRKRIQINHSEIEEVEKKQEATVELLSRYLDDENEKIVADEIIVKNNDIAKSTSEENKLIFMPEIHLDNVQEALVEKIIQNSFKISQSEVDKYATANGMFKNQLIDSINEACNEYLDGEALIEEDDENYTIEESYYMEVANRLWH